MTSGRLLRLRKRLGDPHLPWQLRAFGTVAEAYRRDPVLTRRLARDLRFTKRSWRSFSLHMYGHDFLAAFYEESHRLGMRPFLFWGTLLGCVREAGFIAHDYDIDLAILPEDEPGRPALISAMTARGYLMRRDDVHHFAFSRRDRLLHLDVDVLHVEDGRLATVALWGDGSSVVNRFSSAAIGRPRPAVFLDDVEVWLPENPEKVLEEIYGDWRTPRRDYDSGRDPRSRAGDPHAT